MHHFAKLLMLPFNKRESLLLRWNAKKILEWISSAHLRGRNLRLRSTLMRKAHF